MAPPRKKSFPSQGREYKIRLPEDVAQRIEEKAKGEQRPQNRIIINELAAFPRLELDAKFAERLGHMEVVLARYAAQQTSHDVTDALLKAVDAVLAAQGGALPAAIEKLRVARLALEAIETEVAKQTQSKRK